MKQTQALLAAISRAQTQLVHNVEPRSFFDELLASLLELTDSEYGFIGEMITRPDGSSALRTFALTNIAWDAATRAFYAENAPVGMVFENRDTLFGAVMTTERIVISNDPSTDPRSGGTPPGHPPLKSFMGMPFHSGREMVGMVGIANRPNGYDESLRDFLEPFVAACANIIGWWQAQQRLSEEERRYAAIVERVGDAVLTIDPESHTIRTANRAARTAFGRTDLVGRTLPSVFAEPSREAITEWLASGDEEPKSDVVALNGDQRVPLEVDQAEIVLRGHSLRSIVARRPAETTSEVELEQMSRRLAAVTNAQRLGTLITDGDGVIRWANQAARPLVVRQPVGVHWTEAVQLPADEAARLSRAIARGAETLTVETIGHGVFECSVAVDPVDKAGRLLSFRDLTEVRKLRREVRLLTTEQMIGDSPPMVALLEEISALADGDLTTIIEGETGVGKELVARALHAASGRSNGRFLAVNCATLSQELLSSQLFGHAKGAFTGASIAQKGFFEAAHGGTIFLDEIGDLPLSMQPALLRVLESGEIVRVGETRTRKVDVRVIAATNQPLQTAVDEGRFRQDLFFRLRVGRIIVPPLRERSADIPLLALSFIAVVRARTGEHVASISDDALARLEQYRWPGNVRELKHAIEYAAARARSSVIEVADLPPEIRDGEAAPGRPVLARAVEAPKGDDERSKILEALRVSGGNRAKAARMLGMSRSTFYRRLSAYDID